MKKLIFFLFCFIGSTALGLYFRPSYPLVGQLNWQDVVTKGYFQGKVLAFFNQSYIDESFWYVFRYTSAGVILGLVCIIVLGGSKSKSSSSPKKAKS